MAACSYIAIVILTTMLVHLSWTMPAVEVPKHEWTSLPPSHGSAESAENETSTALPDVDGVAPALSAKGLNINTNTLALLYLLRNNNLLGGTGSLLSGTNNNNLLTLILLNYFRG